VVFLINEEEEGITEPSEQKKKDAPELEGEGEETEKVEEEPSVPQELEDILGDEKMPQVIVLSPPVSEPQRDDKPKVRVIGLIGAVDEDKAAEIIYGMLLMKKTSPKQVLVDEEDPTKGVKTICQPFDMIVSTFGGSAFEMLGIYDMMRQTRDECEIHTHGVGKVMSAGVLLLAAGTKGKRKISENCRVMIHSVIGASHGAIHDLENEMEEIKWMQDRYIKILAKETDMSEKYIKNLLKRKVNVYLNAEQAVELGIADIIV
jgi:ATP-dependent Clp protease protease subunit